MTAWAVTAWVMRVWITQRWICDESRIHRTARRLPVGGERLLTPGEVALARSMFGIAIDYPKVTHPAAQVVSFPAAQCDDGPARAYAFPPHGPKLLR